MVRVRSSEFKFVGSGFTVIDPTLKAERGDMIAELLSSNLHPTLLSTSTQTQYPIPHNPKTPTLPNPKASKPPTLRP